jgi:hypothetical protein
MPAGSSGLTQPQVGVFYRAEEVARRAPFRRSYRWRKRRAAARWARILGCPEALLVKLAMQVELDAAGIKLKIDVKVAGL